MNKTSCPHDPIQTKGPIGQYHCPECGAMVLAGYPHPSDDDVIDQGLEPYKAPKQTTTFVASGGVSFVSSNSSGSFGEQD